MIIDEILFSNRLYPASELLPWQCSPPPAWSAASSPDSVPSSGMSPPDPLMWSQSRTCQGSSPCPELPRSSQMQTWCSCVFLLDSSSVLEVFLSYVSLDFVVFCCATVPC